MKFFSFLIVTLLGVLSGKAQIQVREEPRHHNVLDNKWVRVLDVRIPPGDTSLIHKHSTPSVFMVLSNTKSGQQIIVEPEQKSFSKEGIWFEGFYTTPRIHRVWNSDTSLFHVIDMELPNKNLQPIDPPVNQSSFKLLFDEKPVRGYRVTLSANGKVEVPSRKAPVLVVDLSNSEDKVSVNNTSFTKKGDFLFIKSGSGITLANTGASVQSLAFFELK